MEVRNVHIEMFTLSNVFFCLSFTGYKAGACSHADGVILALKLLLAPIPITSLLVGLVFFYLYPINEARRKQIQQDLGHAR